MEDDGLRSPFYAKVALLVLIGGIAVGSIALRASDPAKNIRIIYTNDTLGYLEPCG